jgi:fatty-acyl-CoA synthase
MRVDLAAGGTLPHCVVRNAADFGDREALVCPEGRWTYAQLSADVAAVADRMQRLGLGRGQRAGVLFPNGSRWLISVLAAQHVGATAVPLNTWYQAEELEEIIVRADTRLVLSCDEAIFGRDYPAMLEQIAARHPATVSAGVHRWRKADALPLGAAPDSSPGAPATRSEDIAYLLFTSGSTDRPKGVLLSHGAIVQVSADTVSRLHIRGNDRAWMPGPLFFGRQSANGVGTTLVAGMTLCLQHQFEPAEALRMLERERCTVLFCNGIHARGIASHPAFESTDLSALRTGTGGANLQEKAFMMDVIGASELCAVYGMTETCGVASVTSSDEPRDIRLNCEGTPIPSQQLRIAEGDQELPRGSQGEIQLRGAILTGYLDPEINARAFTGEGWFRTGDSGWIDEDGRLHYAGRRSDMIKSKGINVSPAEVEAAIRKCDGVAQVVVYGVSDPIAGERVLCLIVPQDSELLRGTSEARDGARRFVSQVVDTLKIKVAKYKIPSEIRLTSFDDLPLMPTGKVNRRELRARAEASSTANPPRS